MLVCKNYLNSARSYLREHLPNRPEVIRQFVDRAKQHPVQTAAQCILVAATPFCIGQLDTKKLISMLASDTKIAAIFLTTMLAGTRIASAVGVPKKNSLMTGFALGLSSLVARSPFSGTDSLCKVFYTALFQLTVAAGSAGFIGAAMALPSEKSARLPSTVDEQNPGNTVIGPVRQETAETPLNEKNTWGREFTKCKREMVDLFSGVAIGAVPAFWAGYTQTGENAFEEELQLPLGFMAVSVLAYTFAVKCFRERKPAQP